MIGAPQNSFRSPMGFRPAFPGRANSMAPAPAAPQPANPNDFYNEYGQRYNTSMSFAPGTSEAYREWAYKNAANQAGYFRPGAGASPASPPAGLSFGEAQAARTTIENQRQQDSWNQQVGDIMRRFPGITPQQAADAAQQDRARSERAGREAWIDQYGTQAQRNDLAGTRGNRQYEEGLRNQIADQRRRDQELMSNPQSWGGSIPKWDGNKWTLPASSPGMAQPIQPPSQGTPYGVTPDKPGMAQPPGSRVDDWRQSDAYRQYQQGVGSGPRSTVVGKSSDGSMFGYQAEARAYDAWRQGQPQAPAAPSQPHVLYSPTGQNMGGGGYGQPPAQSGPPARTYDWAKGGVQPMGGGGMKPPASLPQPRPYDVISGGLQPLGPRPAPQAGGFAAPNNVTMKAYR